MKIFNSVFTFLVLVAVAVSVWGIFIEPATIHYVERKIYLKKWPKELAGFSVAFITDLHTGSPHITIEKTNEIIAHVNALKPDLVLLGGDYVIGGVIGGVKVSSKEIARSLGNLKARYGVFGVLGNHEWWDGGTRISTEFEQHHIPILEDEAKHIGDKESSFWLVGISDYNESAHNVRKAFAHVPKDAAVIAFTHSPDIFPELPANAELTFAGHTHGGQIYVPFLGRPVTNSRYGQRYAIGLVREGDKQLFVGNGIGTSVLPVRILTPPQVDIIKIYPAPDTFAGNPDSM